MKIGMYTQVDYTYNETNQIRTNIRWLHCTSVFMANKYLPYVRIAIRRHTESIWTISLEK